MTIQEMTVVWPTFWAYKGREAQRQQERAEALQEQASLGGRL